MTSPRDAVQQPRVPPMVCSTVAAILAQHGIVGSPLKNPNLVASGVSRIIIRESQSDQIWLTPDATFLGQGGQRLENRYVQDSPSAIGVFLSLNFDDQAWPFHAFVVRGS